MLLDSHINRRGFLGDSATLLGSAALATLLSGDLAPAADTPIAPSIQPGRPHAARHAHFPPHARQVLMIFCSGGFSSIDSFDYKPELVRRHGEPLPGKKLITFQGEQGSLTRPLYPFRPRGQCGKMVSSLVDHLGEFADEMCFVHSVTTKTNSHGPAENVMSTGFTLDGFPSIGAWVSYALGSEASDLPAFVAIPDPRGKPQSSVNNWGPGFLPAAFQGTDFNAAQPIRNLARPASISPAADAATRRFLDSLNRKHLDRFPGDSQLAARIASYRLAARMQTSAREALDISKETRATQELYGIHVPATSDYGTRCLIARRMVERGVRFVQVYTQNQFWDHHGGIAKSLPRSCKKVDQPSAALVTDLKQRGLLDSTVVHWGGEMGRLPVIQNEKNIGRDHNTSGFSMWLAGGGFRGGVAYGKTDEFGHKAVDKVVHHYDYHATLFHLFGLDADKVAFTRNAQDKTILDGQPGKIVHDLLDA